MAATDPTFDTTAGAAAGLAPAGLTDDVAAALAHPPAWDKSLLELAIRWPDPSADPAGSAPAAPSALAATLRVLLLTWDPFEWTPGRRPPFATSTRRPEGYGLVVYLPYWHALALGRDHEGGMAGALGRLGESVLSVAAEHQDLLADRGYATAVQAGRAPGLLSRIPARASLGIPTIELVGPGWQAMKFDVLEDLAQDLFGPAELDRSPVRFEVPGDNRSGCPACAGSPLSFPDGLKDAQSAICPAHRAEALKVITARLEESKASNPAGWAGLLEAGRRLEEPHLPLGLGPRLVAAAALDDPTRAQLEDQAGLVLEAAGMTAGRVDAMRALAGHAAQVQGWLDLLPARLAAAGMDQAGAAVATAAVELSAGRPDGSDQDLPAAPTKPLGPPKPEPIRRAGPRIGRNAPCPCGSGRKYKFCHGQS